MRLILLVIEMLCRRKHFDDIVAILRRVQGEKKHNYLQNIDFGLSDSDKDMVMWLLACSYHELGSLEEASNMIRLLMKRQPRSLRVWNKYVVAARVPLSSQSRQLAIEYVRWR
jgi:hypothetical protein